MLSGCAGDSGIGTAFEDASNSGPQNTSYLIDEITVDLVDGRASVPAAPGSASSIETAIRGDPVLADLNNDGVEDAVVLLTHQTGGSGTFYYVAAAVGTSEGYTGTAGSLLGDRIVPQNVAVDGGKVRVRYLTHAANQSFAETPTVEQIREYMLAPDGRMLIEDPE